MIVERASDLIRGKALLEPQEAPVYEPGETKAA